MTCRCSCTATRVMVTALNTNDLNGTSQEPLLQWKVSISSLYTTNSSRISPANLGSTGVLQLKKALGRTWSGGVMDHCTNRSLERRVTEPKPGNHGGQESKGFQRPTRREEESLNHQPHPSSSNQHKNESSNGPLSTPTRTAFRRRQGPSEGCNRDQPPCVAGRHCRSERRGGLVDDILDNLHASRRLVFRRNCAVRLVPVELRVVSIGAVRVADEDI